MDLDKSPAMILQEKATKRLRAICAEKNTGAQFFARKRDSTLFSNWVPLARVVSSAPHRVEVLWNGASPLARELQAAGIHEIVQKAFRDPVDAAQWLQPAGSPRR